ncbi:MULTISPECIES: helix-turn-helix transcriptional regulator [unclassified Pseudoalteromonas]|uniref:helix-turn-helix domain-containing protein n=1 Tax=unclassified Pseudoalteromonas TaxID=194690 RepID=UPI0032C43BC5
MAKNTNPQFADFGKRLAQLRKAAGYTQQELADEINSTRRVIAYYETESDQPPANILADLARALGSSTDALLGLTEQQTPKLSSRLERRLKKMETLTPKAKRQLVQLIDTFIEAEQLKKQASQ